MLPAAAVYKLINCSNLHSMSNRGLRTHTKVSSTSSYRILKEKVTNPIPPMTSTAITATNPSSVSTVIDQKNPLKYDPNLTLSLNPNTSTVTRTSLSSTNSESLRVNGKNGDTVSTSPSLTISSQTVTPSPTRSTVKLQALMQAKAKADSCWTRYSTAIQDPSYMERYSPSMVQSMQTEYHERLEELAMAYTQAIHYVAREKKAHDSATKAHGILHEWIQRSLDTKMNPFMLEGKKMMKTKETVGGGDDSVSSSSVTLGFSPIYIQQLLKDFSSSSSPSATTSTVTSNTTKDTTVQPHGPQSVTEPSHLTTHSSASSSMSSLTSITSITSTLSSSTSKLSPPTYHDFHNVLHAWAHSKAKKKGFMALQVLYNMTRLAQYQHVSSLSSSPLILPDTKAIALTIKCFASTTYLQAFQKVLELHQIHQLLLDSNITGAVYARDPYVLMYSIKSIKNYKKRNETSYLLLWLDSLTEWVLQQQQLDVCNQDRVLEHEDEEGKDDDDDEEEDNDEFRDASSSSSTTTTTPCLDLTSTFNNIIRNFFYIRGEPGVGEKVYRIFQQMNNIQRYVQTLTHKKSPVTLELKQNAYNMIIATYGHTKDEFFMIQGMKMLDDMIETWKQKRTSTTSFTSVAPVPNDQSFVYGLSLLRNEKSSEKVVKESERLLNEYESMIHGSGDPPMIDSSPKVYNACMDLYTNTLEGHNVLSACCLIIDRMKEEARNNIKFTPNMESYTILLKACSLVTGDFVATIRAYEMATATINSLHQRSGSSPMTDSIYFYMMKCVAIHVVDKDEKQRTILQLFDQGKNQYYCTQF